MPQIQLLGIIILFTNTKSQIEATKARDSGSSVVIRLNSVHDQVLGSVPDLAAIPT